MAMPIWAGVLPCTMTFANPAPDPGITAETPDYVTTYTRAVR
jgi:hypothetical protein